VVGKRAARRMSLIVGHVSDRVVVMTDLWWELIKSFLALLDPPVTAVEKIVAEHTDHQVITADRRWRSFLGARQQRQSESLHVYRSPSPRIGPSELVEATDQGDPSVHGLIAQGPGSYLSLPPSDHRTEHSLWLVRVAHVGCEN